MVTPDPLQIGVDGMGVTQIEVADISDLYGVDLRLTYDPDLVEVVDADPAKPGVQVGLGGVFEGVESFVVKNEAGAGEINFVASRVVPAPGFTGTNSLIEVDWLGKTGGETPLVFDSVKLSDPDGQSLSATPLDGEIQVGWQVIIRGQIKLEGAVESAGVTVMIGDEQQQINTDDEFEVQLDSTGSFFLVFTAPGYLSLRVDGLAPAGQPVVNVGSMTMLAGEVTGDDQIDIFDLAVIGSRYGSNDARGDLNHDGVVDIFDLTISASNYGQQGPISIGLELQ
jgi:hypothetical protein